MLTANDCQPAGDTWLNDTGLSWAQIGKEYAVTRQSAHKRFAGQPVASADVLDAAKGRLASAGSRTRPPPSGWPTVEAHRGGAGWSVRGRSGGRGHVAGASDAERPRDEVFDSFLDV
jgi:hypothetical protein